MESFLNLKIVENNFELDQILIENSQLKEKNTILLASIFFGWGYCIRNFDLL